MADREQRERESRASDETKFEQAREEQREEVAEHADEVRRLPDPEPQQAESQQEE
ncbi:MAG: hypothetical protein ACJ74N_07595 [Gaiellaceae bacterium]